MTVPYFLSPCTRLFVDRDSDDAGRIIPQIVSGESNPAYWLVSPLEAVAYPIHIPFINGQMPVTVLTSSVTSFEDLFV